MGVADPRAESSRKYGSIGDHEEIVLGHGYRVDPIYRCIARLQRGLDIIGLGFPSPLEIENSVGRDIYKAYLDAMHVIGDIDHADLESVDVVGDIEHRSDLSPQDIPGDVENARDLYPLDPRRYVEYSGGLRGSSQILGDIEYAGQLYSIHAPVGDIEDSGRLQPLDILSYVENAGRLQDIYLSGNIADRADGDARVGDAERKGEARYERNLDRRVIVGEKDCRKKEKEGFCQNEQTSHGIPLAGGF